LLSNFFASTVVYPTSLKLLTIWGYNTEMVKIITTLSMALLLWGQSNASAETNIGSADRGLIAVVNLYSTAKKPLKRFLYKTESNHAVNFLERKAGEAYGSVVVLANEEATLERFLEEVDAMTARDDIKVVDVVLDLHGQAGSLEVKPSISFVSEDDKPVATAFAADQLKKVSHSKLRALYSDACHGSKHSQDWLNAGFKVVAGSKSVDGNKSLDIKRFFRFWITGRSFKESIVHANASVLGPFMDRSIHADSTKNISGNEGLSIEISN
jgi:hypothetical protein